MNDVDASLPFGNSSARHDRVDLYDLTKPRSAAWLAASEHSPGFAPRIWKHLYRDLATDVATMPDLPPRVRSFLADRARVGVLPAVRTVRADDGSTVKFLFELHDGGRIETVLMRPARRATVCLSTQVGCPLGCVFCATGQAGFARNLTAGEIVAQAVAAARTVRRSDGVDGANFRLRNVVVMGMGEPLLNYDAVMNALEIVSDSAGLAVGIKQITLSTVGVVPAIERMTDERRPYSLAVSLHAATQEERLRLVPASRTWPLDTLIAACRKYAQRLQRHVFFEWTLIEGVNDAPEQAEALARLLADVPSHVNLIPLNPTGGYDGAAVAVASAAAFQQALRGRGIPSTVRRRRGIDIDAGCGQLATS